MTVTQPDTTSLYGRVASLLGRKVSRPDARKAGIAISNEIVALSHLNREAVLRKLGSSKDGLDAGDAAARLRTMGANSITQEEQPSIVRELLGRAKNPLNGLLLSLAFVSYLLGECAPPLLSESWSCLRLEPRLSRSIARTIRPQSSGPWSSTPPA